MGMTRCMRHARPGVHQNWVICRAGLPVIPAKAGIYLVLVEMDARVRHDT